MRPRIICHMLSSVDGRLIADRWSNPFDGKSKNEFYEQYEQISLDYKAQAWMVGRKTIQEDFPAGNFPYQNYEPALTFEPFMGKRETERFCIVVDPKGKIAYRQDTIDGDNIIAILGETVSEEYLLHLREKGISYVFAGMMGNTIETALETLKSEFGIHELLLCGGGNINGNFLRYGMIDELSLMIYPGIDGVTGMPSIFEYIGANNDFPAQGQSLELLSSEVLDNGVVWNRYKFHYSY